MHQSPQSGLYKPLAFFALIICLAGISSVSIAKDFDPVRQPTTNLQYFDPAGDDYFAGDPMPFYHDGVFHVFWLYDYLHASLGHDWAHMSTTDLIHWQHHPLAIESPDPAQISICTGSAIYHDGTYYAFYATRTKENGRTEFISYSTSTDGIHYTEQSPNPLITAPDGYESAHFRDPHLFYDKDSKTFVMLITTAKVKADLERNRYCLLGYTSPDLKHWKLAGPFYYSGSDQGFAYPECSDLFKWNDTYYLLFKINGGTYYRMSESVNGPWVAPQEDNIGSDYALVFKTAEFKNNRRIAVGFIPTRTPEVDDGTWQYGGNLVFRELVQNPDGTLYAKFVSEMQEPFTKSQPMPIQSDYEIDSVDKFSYISIDDVPVNAHIACQVEPMGNNSRLGMFLRYSDNGFYELSIDKNKTEVSLGSQKISGVHGLDKPFTIEINMTGSTIDVCIAGKRFITNRCYEQKGKGLYLYVHNGHAKFTDLKIQEIK